MKEGVRIKMFEKKYKFFFLRKEYGTMNLVGLIRTNNLSDTIRFKSRTYKISIDKPSFSEGKMKIYIFDFDSGTQLKFDGIESILNPKELDLVVSNGIIKELTEGAISDKKEKIINMILGAIIGALLATMLMFFYMNSKIDEIYKSFIVTPVLGA